jgi:nucleoside-diphosphate-sugar epimerase
LYGRGNRCPDSISASNHTDVFVQVCKSHNDLDYVLHTASPFTFQFKDAEADILRPAIQGTLETLQSVKAYAPKVKRVVLTSSIVTMMDAAHASEMDETRWNPVTWDAAVGNPRLTYIGSKVSSDLDQYL